MATLTVTLSAICSGGNHLTFEVTGDRNATRLMELAELSQPLEPEDADAFIRIIVKMARAGRTLAQTRTLLQNGVTVTV